jgi:hypothetical protein
VGHARAVALAGVVAILQRVFQLIVEVLLGIMGGVLTARRVEAPVAVDSRANADRDNAE